MTTEHISCGNAGHVGHQFDDENWRDCPDCMEVHRRSMATRLRAQDERAPLVADGRGRCITADAVTMTMLALILIAALVVVGVMS